MIISGGELVRLPVARIGGGPRDGRQREDPSKDQPLDENVRRGSLHRL